MRLAFEAENERSENQELDQDIQKSVCYHLTED